MRSNSESFATKCFTEHPTPLRLHAGDVRDRDARGQVRILGVALEVAARERVPVDVDRRREQHVRALAPRLVADPAADLLDELGIPRRAERGAARERGRPTPRPPLAACADRAVGHLQRRGSPGARPRRCATCRRRRPCAAFSSTVSCEMRSSRSCIRAHPRRRRVRSASMPGMDSIRRQGRGGHRRRQRDRARPRARVRGRRRAASSRPTSSRTRSSRPRPPRTRSRR